MEKEVIDILSDREIVNKKILDERKKGFILYLDITKNSVCLTGKIINSLFKKGNLLKETIHKDIQGMVASRGKVIGKVVIVRGVKDLPKVKTGDILVAVTTHPDYVPAMRKASAIVTDEGGITSHAAIISREFGIPCIVGTREATAYLKDGDKIEVDAENGKIKKMSVQ